MSDRSLSPNRIFEMNESKELSEDENSVETSDEENDSDIESYRGVKTSQNISIASATSPCSYKSTEKPSIREASPQGSPRQRILTRNCDRNNPEMCTEEWTVSYSFPETLQKKVHYKKDNSFSGSKLIPAVIAICITVITICIAVIVVFAPMRWDSQVNVNVNIKDPFSRFSKNWLDLKSRFTDQAERFWETIGAATRSVVLQEEPRDPAVILMVIPKSAISTSRCFIDEYVETFVDLLEQPKSNPILFDCRSHAHLSPDKVKLKIDNELQNGFQAGQKVAIIKHLEFLAPEAAMIFYKFCENDLAPFKRVSIVFTFHISDDEFVLSNGTDGYVEDKLNQLWGPVLGEYRFQPLMSRIANSIVFIRPDSSPLLQDCLTKGTIL